MASIETALKAQGIDLLALVSPSSIRTINKIMRSIDDSHLYPINGHFNATDRAIRWFSRTYFPANGPCSNIEYALGLELKVTEYVNDAV
jgi:hypothetical protein